MEKVIIEQFNPVNGYWNKIREIDKELFYPGMIGEVDKYGGPSRVRIVGEPDPVEPKVVEKPEKKYFSKKSRILAKKSVLQTFDDDDGAVD